MRPDPAFSRLLKRVYYRVAHAWRPSHRVQANYRGLRLGFDSSSHISESLFANAFEREQRSVLSNLIRPHQTCVDIGANIGFYAVLFAHNVGPCGRVIAVEPTPSTFATLEENVTLNDQHRIVECAQCALSDAPGVDILHVVPDSGGVYNSLGATDTLASWLIPTTSVEVQTTTLDLLLDGRDLSRGCFIKIDVEGFQHRVLIGGARVLQSQLDIGLMVELHEFTSVQCGYSTRTTLVAMESYGFHFYLISGDSLLRKVSLDEAYAATCAGDSVDVFFIKPGSCFEPLRPLNRLAA